MQLPELKTSGIDVSNTLAKINAMQTNELQQQNYLNEIETRKAVTPSLIAERESTNALRLLQQKEIDKKLANESLNEDVKSTAFIAGLPSEQQEVFYEDFRGAAEKRGVKLPPATAFYTKDKEDNLSWNPEVFKTMAESAIRARKLEVDPRVGVREKLKIFNKTFDPSKAESVENPKMIEQVFISDGFGKLHADPDVPSTPVIDVIGKEQREDKKLTEAERRTKAIEDATAEQRRLANIRAEKSLDISKENLKLNQNRDRRETDKAGKPKELTPAEQISLAIAEEKIQSNPENEAIVGHVEFFNNNSNAPHAYQPVKYSREIPFIGGKFDESIKYEKITLPVIKGVQVTAKDVAGTAKARKISYAAALKLYLDFKGAK